MASHDTQHPLGLQSQFSTFIVIIGLIALTVVAVRAIRPTSSLPYPPGPKSNTLIGNISEVSNTKLWITYANWARHYGSVMHLRNYLQHIIVISSLDDALELLEKRSHIYSDRPTTPMIEMMGWDFSAALLPHGNLWRRHRRLLERSFRKEESRLYQPIQIKKVHEMLRSLLSSPEDFLMHCRTVAAAIIMSAMYGHDISSANDYFVTLAEQAAGKMSGSFFPGAAVVNAIPMLRHLPSWFPGAHFKRFAEEAKYLTDQMQNVPFESVKRKMAQGAEVSGLLPRLLSRHELRGGSQEDEGIIKAVIAASYAAGADTTVSAIGTFFYAMSCNSLAQKRAQEEIDAVTGGRRLPDYRDRASLPYVEALFREVLRWRPVTPLGVSHRVTEDDVYKGHFIPKGATIIANIWAMAHDETKYKTPDLFLPERFFDEGGNLNDDNFIPAFGFGPRGCVGRHLAGSTVWLIIASSLAVFDITPAMDASGQPIPMKGDYTDGLISHPLPFQCSITPRSDRARSLISEPETKTLFAS